MHLVVTNFVQFQTTNRPICYNSAISSRTSLFIYAPQHWSGSCRTCRTGCYGPALTASSKLDQHVSGRWHARGRTAASFQLYVWL